MFLLFKSFRLWYFIMAALWKEQTTSRPKDTRKGSHVLDAQPDRSCIDWGGKVRREPSNNDPLAFSSHPPASCNVSANRSQQARAMGDTHGEIYWIGQRGRLGFNIASDGKVTSRWLRQSRICLQCRRPRFDPWVGKIPWRRKWEPTPVFLPGKSQWTEEPAGCSLCGCKESDMTEWLHLWKNPNKFLGQPNT